MAGGKSGGLCMVKYLFLFVFVMLTTSSYAKDEDAQLKRDFGPRLTQAPFFLRYAFQKKFDKNWRDTDFAEREFFLRNYEKNLASDRAEEKAELKAKTDEEKARLLAKKEALRKQKDRLKAESAQVQAEKKAEADRQKSFNQTLKTQEKQLQQMQQDFIQQKEESQEENR